MYVCLFVCPDIRSGITHDRFHIPSLHFTQLRLGWFSEPSNEHTCPNVNFGKYTISDCHFVILLPHVDQCYLFTHIPVGWMWSKPWDGSLTLPAQNCNKTEHYSDVIMDAMASQITSLTIVYLTIYTSADQRKHQSSTSLAFVRGIHRWPVNSPHKWPVTRKMFPFDDVIMESANSVLISWVGMLIRVKKMCC